MNVSFLLQTSPYRVGMAIAVLVAFFLCGGIAGPFQWPIQPRAHAASLAENHTVLYYLIEMHRQLTKNCNGAPMPEAPSLMPSEALRRVAMESASSGQLPEAYAASAGLSGVPHFAVVLPGPDPRQAFTALIAARCQSVMSSEFRYVGAFQQNGQWTLILSASEPGQQTAPAPVAQPSDAQRPAPQSAASPTSARDAESQVHAPLITGNAPHPGEDAASPYATGKMEAGAVDRPVGLLIKTAQEPHTPSPQAAASGDGSVPPAVGVPSGGPETAKNEPSAPASPYVVGEIEVNALGQAVGPLKKTPAAAPQPLLSETPAKQQQAEELHSGKQAPALTPPAPGELSSEARVPGPPQSPIQGADAVPASSQQAQRPREHGVTPLQDERQSQTAPPAFGVFSPEAGNSQTSATGQQAKPRQTGSTATPNVIPPSNHGVQDGAHMLRLVNAARAQGHTCGGKAMSPVQTLQNNPSLTAAANAHAYDMSARRYFASTSPDGKTLGRRVSETGYVWGFVAENIAAKSNSAEIALQNWLADEQQCRNIMGQEYRDAGIGHDPSEGIWVFTLASPLEEGALLMR